MKAKLRIRWTETTDHEITIYGTDEELEEQLSQLEEDEEGYLADLECSIKTKQTSDRELNYEWAEEE